MHVCCVVFKLSALTGWELYNKTAIGLDTLQPGGALQNMLTARGFLYAVAVVCRLRRGSGLLFGGVPCSTWVLCLNNASMQVPLVAIHTSCGCRECYKSICMNCVCELGMLCQGWINRGSSKRSRENPLGADGAACRVLLGIICVWVVLS